MDFKFGDRVEIISGFYSNCEGNIVDEIGEFGMEYTIEINIINGMVTGEPFVIDLHVDLLNNRSRI